MFYLIGAFILGFLLAGLYFRVRNNPQKKSLSEQPHEVTITDNAGTLNLQYNEMISEVSGLIQESLEKAKVDREIEIARSVQDTILPPQASRYENISVAGRSYVAGSCGGDWWYHARVKDTIIVWLGDVTGHGVASALVASAARAVASSVQITHLDHSLAEWLQIMNEVIFNMTAGNIYLTLVCLKIDIATEEVEIVNASHPSLISLSKNGDTPPTVLNEPLNPPVGSASGSQFQTMKIKLPSKSGLFLTSDGLLDMPQPEDVRWNLKGLCQFLKMALSEESGAEAVIKKVDQLMPRAVSIGLPDDVTFAMVFRD